MNEVTPELIAADRHAAVQRDSQVRTVGRRQTDAGRCGRHRRAAASANCAVPVLSRMRSAAVAVAARCLPPRSRRGTSTFPAIAASAATRRILRWPAARLCRRIRAAAVRARMRACAPRTAGQD